VRSNLDAGFGSEAEGRCLDWGYPLRDFILDAENYLSFVTSHFIFYNRFVMNTLTQFEELAERLVEGTFARLFAGHLAPAKVAAHLTRAIEDHRVCALNGASWAPTHYSIYLNPDDHTALLDERPSLEQDLSHHVTELAAEANMALATSPVVRVLSEESILPRDVRIEARHKSEEPTMKDVERTREMLPEEEPEVASAASEGPRGHPFLILEGHRHINLKQSVVSIGRALDNDVIIEDPRVSRHHAQLRQRYGHYVLYDLGSTGGTQINGYPIEECVLHSGDVISFAGVQVIYGEDPPTPIPLPEDEDTKPFEASNT
jgi:hypothetical protein